MFCFTLYFQIFIFLYLKISLRYLNNFIITDSGNHEETQSISRFINHLYWWIYSSYTIHKNQIDLYFILKPKITLIDLIRFHSLSLLVICCYSLSLTIPLAAVRCSTPCHSLSLDLPLVCIFINDPFPRVISN